MKADFHRLCRRPPRRLKTRDLCSELAEISWDSGRAVAILEDASPCDGSMICPVPVPEGRLLHLALAAGDRRAIVRSCMPFEDLYLVGLKFLRDSRSHSPAAEHHCQITSAE